MNIFIVQRLNNLENYDEIIVKAFKYESKAIQFVCKCEKEISRIEKELIEFNNLYQVELNNIANNIKLLISNGLRKKATTYKRNRRIKLSTLKMNIISSHKYDIHYVHHYKPNYQIATIDYIISK